MASTTFLQLNYRPEIHKSANLVTAVCRELNIAAVGATEDDAREALIERTRMYCEAMAAKGSLMLLLGRAGLATKEIQVERHDDEAVVLVVSSSHG